MGEPYLKTGILAVLLERTNKNPLLLMFAVSSKHTVGFVRAFSSEGQGTEVCSCLVMIRWGFDRFRL
jgi:hypothetical protein